MNNRNVMLGKAIDLMHRQKKYGNKNGGIFVGTASKIQQLFNKIRRARKAQSNG